MTTPTSRRPSYAPLSIGDGDYDAGQLTPSRATEMRTRDTLRNFTLMSVCFSANHGCVVGK